MQNFVQSFFDSSSVNFCVIIELSTTKLYIGVINNNSALARAVTHDEEQKTERKKSLRSKRVKEASESFGTIPRSILLKNNRNSRRASKMAQNNLGQFRSVRNIKNSDDRHNWANEG